MDQLFQHTQKLKVIPIFFPIEGFFLKMVANNQSSGRKEQAEATASVKAKTPVCLPWFHDSLMKMSVTGILDPVLFTAGLERCNNKGIAEAKYQRLMLGALKDWKLGINKEKDTTSQKTTVQISEVVPHAW